MELLNNTIKHSEARQAKLSIQENNESLQIAIIDNGKGFDSTKFHILEGFGLNQIKARLNHRCYFAVLGFALWFAYGFYY